MCYKTPKIKIRKTEMNQTEIEVLTFSSFSPQWIILPHAWVCALNFGDDSKW